MDPGWRFIKDSWTVSSPIYDRLTNKKYLGTKRKPRIIDSNNPPAVLWRPFGDKQNKSSRYQFFLFRTSSAREI